jgi:Tfp pilus assembly protein PilX
MRQDPFNSVKSSPRKRSGAPLRRPGFVTLTAVVLLAIVGALMAVWLRNLDVERRQTQLAQRETQAAVLAEAGIQRGISHLRKDSKYAGETWHVPAIDLAGQDDAIVTIRITPTLDVASDTTIEAVADYPTDPLRRARRIERLSFKPPSEDKK